MTDTKRYKSTGISLETHLILKQLSTKKHRSINSMVRKLVDDYVEFQASKKGMKAKEYLKKELGVSL